MTTPGVPPPDGAISGSDLSSLDGLSEASWRQGLYDRVIGSSNGNSGFNGLHSAFSGIADSFGSVFDSIFNLGNRVEVVEDGQLDLNDRTDLLSPLLDFGSAYAPGQGDLINTGKVPFTRPIGPHNGCHLDNAAFVLDEVGLWDIRARLAFSFTVAPGGGKIGWEIRTYYPGGGGTSGIFSVQRDECTDSAITTREMNTTVVVPTPGYRVEVRITDLIAVRATQGGPSNNRFTVQHISRSTANPI